MDSALGKGSVDIALVDPDVLAAGGAHPIVAGPAPIAPADDDGWPWLAGDDDTLAIVWSDASGGGYDVRFAELAVPGLAASSTLSLRGPAPMSGVLARMIRTTDGFLAAWEDQRGDDNSIYMALVDAQGRKTGGGLVEEEGSGDANWPNMAWTGAAAGIVYYQYRDARPQIFMSFVDSSGARVGGLSDLQVSSGSGGWSKYPDVAWTGSGFDVMFVDTRDGAAGLWLQAVTCTSREGLSTAHPR
jgi:hypothetical protein